MHVGSKVEDGESKHGPPSSGSEHEPLPPLTGAARVAKAERKEWDSNPRRPEDLNGFRGRPIRPLWHPSGSHASGRPMRQSRRWTCLRFITRGRATITGSRGSSGDRPRRVRRPSTDLELRADLGAGALPPRTRIPGRPRPRHRLRQAGNWVVRSLRRGANVEQRCEDILTVMDAAGLERATLVGWSEGGLMSQLFTVLHPPDSSDSCLEIPPRARSLGGVRP